MSSDARLFRRLAGLVLVKLKRGDTVLTDDEHTAAWFLAGEGLAEFVGPSPSTADFSRPGDVGSITNIKAASHFRLTDRGLEFVKWHDEERLKHGDFTLPNDPRWHDAWWAKVAMAVAAGLLGAAVAMWIGNRP